MRTLAVGRGRVQSVAFDPDGGSLAFANDREVRYVPPDGGPGVVVRAGSRSRSLSFSPDGRLAGWEPAGVWVWDPATGYETMEPTGSERILLALAWHEGKLLRVLQRAYLTVRDDHHFRGTLAGDLQPSVVAAAGRHVALVERRPKFGPRPMLHRFDFSRLPPGPAEDVSAGRRFLVTPGGGWREFTAGELCAFSGTSARLPTAREPRVLALAADSASVLTADGDRRTVRWLDATSGAERAAWAWPVGPIMSLALAPDGLTAAAGDSRGRVIVWDLA